MGGRRRGWAAVLLAGATGVTGVGSVLWFTALPAAAFTSPVEIVARAFDPQVTRIETGDKVLWRNRTDEKHSVTSDTGAMPFDYTLGARGATEERRFEAAGTYTYHCRFHPQMTGRVEVVDPSAPTTTSSTAPAATTSTAPPTTTTTLPPPTITTATTAPPTTTTTAGRQPAAVPLPPVPSSAAAPPSTTATSATAVPSSTTTTVPPTTATSSAPPPVAAAPAPPAESPQSTEAPPVPDTGDDIPSAAGRPTAAGGGLDPATVALISILVAVGLFAAWTLVRVRPGRI